MHDTVDVLAQDAQVDLERLYALVPAAQEEDLLDELEDERWQHDFLQLDDERERAQQLRPGSAETVDPLDDELEDDEADEPLRPGQVLGLIQHQLGGVVLPDEPEGEPEPPA